MCGESVARSVVLLSSSLAQCVISRESLDADDSMSATRLDFSGTACYSLDNNDFFAMLRSC